MSDEFIFAPENSESEEELCDKREPWKIIIADDDEDVHKTTRLVLKKFSFENSGLTLLSAYSGEECKKLVRDNPDTAVLLLDVVMEHDHAGLEVVRYIRRELKNTMLRIILRTGYPGQAPERKVVMEYDINDYKQKSELTVQRLYTAMVSAIRSFRDIRTIEKNRQGLSQIISSSGDLFARQSLNDFTIGVLSRLCKLIGSGNNTCTTISGFTAIRRLDSTFTLNMAVGDYGNHLGKPLDKILQKDDEPVVSNVLSQKKGIITEDVFAAFFSTKSSQTSYESVLFLKGLGSMTDLDKGLLQVFSHNTTMALSNICLNNEIVDTQKEMIITLGEVVETRSKETANHVQRVAECSRELARLAGMCPEESDTLRLASPMHDVGKIGIPDSILMKPGKLSQEEFATMQNHTSIGHHILNKSNREIMQAASIIALQHHERWNGQGYPQGLEQENIHVFGRITGIIDVFDALLHKRVYKTAWELGRVLDFLKTERERHFDPALLDLFIDNLDTFIAITQTFPDSSKQ